MVLRPTGTVTFLFTDMEGSTKLARQFADVWPKVQAHHYDLLQDAITSHQGYLFQTVGDEIDAAFASALEALAAALAIQRALPSQDWGGIPSLAVRMGLHTGQAILHAVEYEGYLTLSHAKRLMTIAYGGQILLSEATEALLRDSLPEEMTLRDLGEHRLKDFERPEHIFQVVAPDLPADFPPLKTFSATPNNLPAQLTSFVGRERELAELHLLIRTTRLLTLTGPGGTGKTRLALKFAKDLLEKFPEGSWLIELAPIANPALVAQNMAATLGVREQPGRTILDALGDYLRAKTMLLILDNCEHLIEICAQLTDILLRAAPDLKILATSRESLGIIGETAYRVPSLALPDLRHPSNLDELAQNDCVHLFVDRASAASPHFRLSTKNASAVTQICRRLDGIPLAIELAASRTKVFPPEQIAARLDDRFRLLTGGSRTALERHQTLQALIDWSYELLSDAERQLLRRLSVFSGSWSIEAVKAVGADEPDNEVLDTLAHLVDKSLVIVEEETEEGRYHLLETIRQYGRNKLLESGEIEVVRDRHLEYYLNFAEAAEPNLRGSGQIEWMDRVEGEHDNLRTALAWSLESDKPNHALRLAGALCYFWELRGYWSEGKKWLDDALVHSGREQKTMGVEVAARAKALYGAGRMRSLMLSDWDVTYGLIDESLRLYRKLRDKWWTAVVLENLGYMLIFAGDFKTARLRLEEGVALARAVEDRWPLALCLIHLASPLMREDIPAAHLVLEEGVPLAQRLGDISLIGFGLIQLASVNLIDGNITAAESVAKEALAQARATGGNIYVQLALLGLVIIACLQSVPVKAKDYCSQLADLAQETGHPLTVLFALTAFGFVASINGQPEQAAQLLKAVEVGFHKHGLQLNLWGGAALMAYHQFLEMVRVQLGPMAFEAASTAGQNMSLDQALALATESEVKK